MHSSNLVWLVFKGSIPTCTCFFGCCCCCCCFSSNGKKEMGGWAKGNH